MRIFGYKISFVKGGTPPPKASGDALEKTEQYLDDVSRSLDDLHSRIKKIEDMLSVDVTKEAPGDGQPAQPRRLNLFEVYFGGR